MFATRPDDPAPSRHGAVFLSYASQDAAVVEEMCLALRAAGVEVWFDRNELRGGDEWDANIRRQIRECMLFVPFVSAQTQARREGYFRREWKLAVERLNDMAEGTPFLVPVAMDNVRDNDALVPEPFLRKQWIRWQPGQPCDRIVERVQTLLGIPAAATVPVADVGKPALARMVTRESRRNPATMRTAIAVAATAALGGLWWWTQRASTPPISPPVAPTPTAGVQPAAAPDRKSVAVLPFASMSEAKEDAWFADGIHEDLLTNLAKIRGLQVISRTSVLPYRGAERNLRRIAGELGVAHVLEGSVRRAGGKVRITVQLIDALTDRHLWAESYDRELTDVFAIQAAVAHEITRALQANLTPEEKERLNERPTRNEAAYEAYLKGLQLVSGNYSFEAYKERAAAFGRAVELDPDFALAWAQLSIAHGLMYWFQQLDPSPERLAQCKAAAERAQQLAPEATHTRLALGLYYYRGLRDYPRALAELVRVEVALPNDPQVLESLAALQRRLGLWDESNRSLERLVALSPGLDNPREDLASNYSRQRRYTDALKIYEELLSKQPKNEGYLRNVAEMQYAIDGDLDAREARLAVLAPGPTASPDTKLQWELQSAFRRQDHANLLRILESREFGSLRVGDVRFPDAVFRCAIAYLLGDQAKTEQQAKLALAEIPKLKFTERQETTRMTIEAQLLAMLGRKEEARGLLIRAAAREAERPDALDTPNRLLEIGETYLIMGDRDSALEFLEKGLLPPGPRSANHIRHGNIWPRLAGDPRFERILAQAAPR